MIRCCWGLALAALMVSWVSPTGAQTASAEDPLAQNAALKYWLAIEALPADKLDEKTVHEMGDVLSKLGPVDEKLAAMLKAAEPALREFHRGAALPRCQWALSPQDGPDMTMPLTKKLLLLGRVSCLRALWRFQQGKQNEAIDDLLDTMTFARQISKPSLIELLLDYVFEEEAACMAAANLNKLDAAAIKRLAEGIEKLPAAATARQAMETERQLSLEWLIRNVAEPGAKEKALALCESLAHM